MQPKFLRALAAVSFLASASPFALAVCPEDGATPFTAGPVDPVNGFATYVQDSEGLALEICLDSVTGDGNPPFCFFDPPIVGNTFSETIGFGPEAFWWLAGTDIPTSAGRALIVMGTEAAWAAEIPVDGDQFPFTRLRIRIDVPAPGQYTVIHPFGTSVFDAPADLFINESFDIPFLPDAVNQGRVGPWLTWDTFPGDPLLVGPGGEQYVGDGATPHRVKGAPCGNNRFRVEGPPGVDLDGAGNNFVETDLFTVQGRVHPIATPTPLTVDAVTFSRGADDQVRLNVFATAPTTATVTCDVCPAALATEGNGTFFTSFTLPDVPSLVTVTADNSAANPASTPTDIDVTPNDVVTISQALYDRAAETLTVSATSSDQGTSPPTLRIALDDTPLVGGTATIGPLTVAPATVTVVSEQGGGSDSEPVKIINNAP